MKKISSFILFLSIAFFIASYYFSYQEANGIPKSKTGVDIKNTGTIAENKPAIIQPKVKPEQVVAPPQKVEPPHGDYYKVNFDWLNIRQGPSTKTSIVKKILKDDQIELLEKVDLKWYKVKILTTNEIGFASSEYLTKISDGNKPEFSVPIFMYHHVGPLPPNADEIRKGLTVSSEKFEEQIKWLSDNKIRPITFIEAETELKNSSKINSKTVILTFDDGYKDNITYALPVLQKYNFKGVFFIITGFVGKNEYLDWNDIQKLKDTGMEIGSHTINHPDLSIISAEKIKTELTDSKKTLQEKLGIAVISLCYPAGKYTDQVIQIAKDSGYLFARTTLDNLWTQKDNLFTLPEKRMVNNTKIVDFEGWFK